MAREGVRIHILFIRFCGRWGKRVRCEYFGVIAVAKLVGKQAYNYGHLVYNGVG